MKKNKDKKKKSGGGVDFGRYLRGLNKHLDKAKETAGEGGFEEFDDGRYRMRAVDAKIGVSKNKRVQVVITWKFMSGDYKGKTKLDFEGLTEDHLPYLLRKLDAMGYDTSELENLEDELKDILEDIKKSKPKCKVRLKTKGEFQNLYVDGVLGDDDEEEEEEEDEEEEDEKPKKKGKKKDDDEEEEEEDDDEEESDDDDEEEEDSDDEEQSDEDEEEEDEEEDEEEEPKKKGKKKGKKDEDEDEEEEEEEDEEDDEEEETEDEIEVVVGSVVKAESKKLGKIKGTIVELFENEGKVLLKTDKGKTLKIKADAITSVEEAPAESVPKKKKKSKK